MGFDIVGFCEAAPGTGIQGIARGLNDQRYTEPGGDQIRIKTEAAFLLGVYYAAESTPDNTRVRQESRNQDLQFIQATDLNNEDPLPGFSDYLKDPILLRAREAATCLSVNATDEDLIIAWLLGPGKFGPPVSPTHIIHAESDQTLTANTWTPCATLTYDQELPDGLYYIVGMKAASWITAADMGGLARLILDKTTYRPGVPYALDEADKTSRFIAYPAPYEKWGLQKDLVFHSKSMPQLELLSPAAMTDHRIELAVVAADKADIGNLRPD